MIYRGQLVELDADGRGWVRIPALAGSSAVGPLQIVPAGLSPDEGVLVASLRGRSDDLIVFSRELEADPGAPDWAEILNKPTTFPAAVHTHALSSLTGRLDFSQLPAFPELPAGVDLNSYITDGIWHQSQNADTASPAANYPAATAGLLEVKVATSTFVYQRYTVYNTGAEYTRARYNGSWSAWRLVPSRAEINAAFAPISHTHLWAHITDKPATFAPSAHGHAWTDLSGVPATFAPSAHTHTAAEISDASTIGRTVLKAADAAAARTAIGAGTSSLVLGTGSTNAMPGNRSFNYSEIVGTVPTAALPPLAVIDTTPVASQAAMLALPAQRGDMAIRTDIGKTYVLSTDSPGTLADWKEVLAAGQVTSVAGKTGVVSLVKADVGLGSVDNTADISKPVSTAQQTALNGKANTAHTHAIADVTGLQTQLDAKALASDIEAYVITLPAATALPNAYPTGISVGQIAAETGWPDTYSTVTTYRYGGSRSYQEVVKKITGERYWRAEGDANAWGAWQQVATDFNAGTGPWIPITLLNGWTGYTGGGNYYNGLRVRRVGRSIQVQGMIKGGAVSSIVGNFPSDLIPTDSAIHVVACGNTTTARSVGYFITGVSTRGSAATLTYDSGLSAPTFVSIDFLTPIYETP
ncbi:minor tail protein [Arthrobacter phage Altadena]|uniref:Minor tail protein n=1 Tax=Arthrobacter phage Altadena TaxID=3059064 RepID=A0AA96KHQ9_9CAUD|nr:minor tail protein [Arthrobacter phage Altadena]